MKEIRRPNARGLIAALFVGLLLRIPVVAAPTAEPVPYGPPVKDALTAGLVKVLASKTSPSVSVAFVEHGKIVFVAANGKADVAKGIDATVHTRYHIGSVSKIFTAVAVMQLVDKKKVDLGAKVAAYLPWAPHAGEITVRELLMHRSGLPNYLDKALNDGSVAKPTTPRAIVDLVAQLPLDFTPGATYEYSNTNYVLLGLIVEHVSGLPLGTYLEKNVFVPAEMKETTFTAPPPGTPVAVGYSGKGDFTVADPGHDSWYYACGSLYSTAEDLARFDVALMGGRLMPAAAFAQMSAEAKPTEDAVNSAYGLGLQCFKVGDRAMVGHHGGLPGFESDDEMIPADGFAIVVLGNDFTFPTSSVMNVAISTFYPDLVKMLAAKGRAPPPDPSPATTAKVLELMRQVQAGKVDPALVAPSLMEVLAPDKIGPVKEQFNAYGAVKSAAFAGLQRIGTYVKQYYRVTFADKTLVLTFVFDADGKVAGFFLE